MKQKILNMLVALTAMVGSASAQTLSIASIKAEAGAQEELVVTGASLSGQTALQFNLSLPAGITLNEAAITKGAAASGHELSVSTLSSGDRLFVLYGMNLDTFKDGELLRIPITIGDNAKSGEGSLTTIRFATTEAVSNAGTDTKFNVTVQEPAPEGFSNSKLYTLTCKRGGLVMNAEGTGLAAGQTRTDAPEADKRFAIITYNNAQYLYCPTMKQYLLADGSFVSRLGSPVTFDESKADGEYKYMLSTQGTNGEIWYFNNNGSGKIVINSWDTPDDGNRWLIEPVADFDPTEALAMASNQTYMVTYEVLYDGKVVATATEEVASGNALPAPPTSLKNEYITLSKSGTHPTTVTQDVTVKFTATWNGPFEFSKNVSTAKWYNMTIHTNYYVGKQDSEPYYPTADADDELKTEAYHWAFGGDPYHVKVYNRTTGFSETLAKDGDNAVMRVGDYTWDLLANSDGFVLRETGTPYKCINQIGGNGGPLKFWDNSGSLTDDGSTFRVEEAQLPDDAVTVTAENKTMVYGDDVPALTYKTEGAALNGTPKLSTTATKTSPVGTYPIKVEAGSVTNTQVTYVDGTLTITQAPLSIGVQNVTITEGDAIPEFTLTYRGWRNGDTEATAFTTKPTATTSATSASAPGTYPITVSGGSAKNYELSYTNGTLTIIKKDEPQPEGFSNSKLYTLTCKRGGLAMNAEGTGLTVDNTRTDLPEADKRFAIITYNNAQYLYSPTMKQYLLADGSFVSRLGSPVTFDESKADGEYKYMLSTQGTNGEIWYFNNNGSGKIVINSWDTPDDGNRWLIEPVADFDPTEALAMASNQTYMVTYEVLYDGKVVATATEEVASGNALPAPPTSLKNEYITLSKSGTHPTTVTQDVTVKFTATWNGPFEFSKNVSTAKWYNMTIHTNYYVGKQDSEPYYPTADADDELKTEAYHWAFGGDPYHVKVYNRTTGFSETLAKDGDNAVMRVGDYTWDLLANSDGFLLRETGTPYNCVNQYGGNGGPLKFWDNSGSLTDDGSTFRVEEAQPLYDAIETLSSRQSVVDDTILFNLNGQRINRLQRGVIIRRNKGKIEKILVK